MHRHAKQFFRQAGDAMNGQRNTSQRTQQHTSQGSSVMSDGETIIDQRDPETANRKIFERGEGEYVDFKEEE